MGWGIERTGGDRNLVAFATLDEPLAAGQLGTERENPAWEPPEDTRSVLERNPRLVEGSLVVVALALGVGGFFALRRRA